MFAKHKIILSLPNYKLSIIFVVRKLCSGTREKRKSNVFKPLFFYFTCLISGNFEQKQEPEKPNFFSNFFTEIEK